MGFYVEVQHHLQYNLPAGKTLLYLVLGTYRLKSHALMC